MPGLMGPVHPQLGWAETCQAEAAPQSDWPCSGGSGQGTHLGGWKGPERQPSIYHAQVPRDALGKKAPWSKELGKAPEDPVVRLGLPKALTSPQAKDLGLFDGEFFTSFHHRIIT